MEKIKLSIIIPTHNEEKDILECLNSIINQSYKNFEIIVVDDGSTDNTLDILNGFSKRSRKLKILQQNHKGPGEARNFGAEFAKGSILIFVDADMTFDKDYLKNLTKPILDDKNAVGTTHDYEIAQNTENIWSRCWGKNRIIGKYIEHPAIFRAIRKDKFFERGGFDSKYGYADDQTFWFKYKISPIFAREAKCYHKNPETLKAVFNQSRWIGASIDNIFIKTPLIKYLTPFLMIIIFPISVPILSFKKCYNNKDFKIFCPWMLIFMCVRYIGTITGIFNNIYLNKNVR